jgi:hypothetical protein
MNVSVAAWGGTEKKKREHVGKRRKTMAPMEMQPHQPREGSTRRRRSAESGRRTARRCAPGERCEECPETDTRKNLFAACWHAFS